MYALITFTTIGIDAGPFNLYSDVDGYVSAFETGVTRTQLLAGFTSANVPVGTSYIRAKSFGGCINYVDVLVPGGTTSTTTSSTTVVAGSYMYMVDTYDCICLVPIATNVPLFNAFPLAWNTYYFNPITGLAVHINDFGVPSAIPPTSFIAGGAGIICRDVITCPSTTTTTTTTAPIHYEYFYETYDCGVCGFSSGDGSFVNETALTIGKWFLISSVPMIIQIISLTTTTTDPADSSLLDADGEALCTDITC